MWEADGMAKQNLNTCVLNKHFLIAYRSLGNIVGSLTSLIFLDSCRSKLMKKVIFPDLDHNTLSICR